ncbi:hypothetical protein [Agrobacterium tumefaciens]|uniref:hypothetical protein n=1 Tax=Agrobacterium tumefaciens TaxID=358 RepID=UPI001574ECC9|nr:hypothetical protein [Agrobacterium tumefaciens]WCK01048.1 hypothetical protein G6L31_007130 [Agrobacterium tumefaciens]
MYLPVCIASGLCLQGLFMQDLYSDFNQLMVRAHKAKIAETEIIRVAGLHSGYIRRIRKGEIDVTQKTLRRIGLAISRIQRGDKQPEGAFAAAAYRMAVCMVANQAQVPASFILDADPSRRATADPAWLRAAKLRRIAVYICCSYLGFSHADIARAAGMSKATVSYNMQDVEDERGEPDVKAILDIIHGAFQS